MKSFDKWKVSTYFKAGLLCVVLMSLAFGLTDCDYYWQIKLGESIFRNGKFNDFGSLTWLPESSWGYYLDHSWLANVVFYLTSLIPYGLVILKALMISGVCMTTYYFVKAFKKHEDIATVSAVVIMLMIAVFTLFRVKTQTITYIFMMLELLVLVKDCSEKRKLLYLCLISVLWVNIHGSFPLFICIGGLYILCDLIQTRKLNTKLCIIGVLSTSASLLNPFGYKLVLFDLLHNGDDTMKSILKDWSSLDCKTTAGVLVFIVLVIYLVSLIKAKKIDMFSFLLSVAMLFMTLSSFRHAIYFIPSVILILCVNQYNPVDKRILCMATVLVSIVFGGAGLLSLVTCSDYRIEYGYKIVSEEEIKEIKRHYAEIDYRGLFIAGELNALVDDEIKLFNTSLYPLEAERQMDSMILNGRASEETIEQIISYYSLTGFVILEQSSFGERTFYSPLYNYLRGSVEYECIFDNGFIAFFTEVDK